ncbi:MAG TPA: rRNA pseudouridine synthase [Candidatus Avirikenella pullistercoris]|nr:rRNA pseudouridine synthase [Candidatus Avirikenella pullistercoris]
MEKKFERRNEVAPDSFFKNHRDSSRREARTVKSNDRTPRYKEHGEGERRSFNPNFDRNNRIRRNNNDNEQTPRRERNSERESSLRNRRFSRNSEPQENYRKESYAESGEREQRRNPYRKGRSEKKREFGREQEYTPRNGERRQRVAHKEKETEPVFFTEPLINREIRLNRYIAMSGICSRREADDFIKAGVVKVNGVVVTELGTKISANDEIRFNDEIIHGEKKVYILMNKPKGYVTTLDDPNAERTVIDLLKGKVPERIYPVGRLDKNTMGVLLLTNDGDLTKELTHPSYQKKKIYHVFLDKNLSIEDMERIAEGVELEDGIAYADEISFIGDSKKEVGVEIHSGRNRIVRRLFEHFGYKVQKLDRVYFAGLTKKGLQRGFWRYLTPKEIGALKSGIYQ